MSAVHQPDGAAFDVVLLLHVVCVVAGLVTTATAVATASRLRRLLRSGGAIPDPLRRYFRPGVNWAGRTVYGIPVFGFALVAMSQGAYALRDGWIVGGLALFALLVLLSEGVLWPAERHVQAALLGTSRGPVPAALADTLERAATAMGRAGGGSLVLLVAATVLMIAQP